MGQTAVIFAGGGTGGHLYPGIAVAEELAGLSEGVQCVFCGSDRPLEQRILASHGLEHHPLSLRPLASVTRNPAGFFWRLMQARREALQLLRRVQPEAVVGLGGLSSLPMVSAAHSAGVPTVLLEQNIVAGRASRWLSRRAGQVCCAWPDTVGLGRCATACTTGNPVRRTISQLHSDPAADGDGVAGERELLILGGSQGALTVNNAVMQMTHALKDRLRGWRIVHQTGTRQEDEVRRHYPELGLEAEVAAFFDDLDLRYPRAAMAISRAGATSLAELACAGTPAILLPIPDSVGDHQMANAVYFASSGAAQIVRQLRSADQTAQLLGVAVERLLDHPEDRQQQRKAMQQLAMPAAARDVATRLLQPASESVVSSSDC